MHADDDALALECVEHPRGTEPAPTASAGERIAKLVAEAWPSPVAFSRLLATCQMRKATLCQQLAEMTRLGRILKTDSGYTLPSSPSNP